MWVISFLSLTVPLSCLNGLCSSSQTIYNAMLNGTPCVILESSGRIADVIAQVAGLPVSRITIALIHQLMKKFFGQEYENFPNFKIIEWTKKVCVHTDDLNSYRLIYSLSLLVASVAEILCWEHKYTPDTSLPPTYLHSILISLQSYFWASMDGSGFSFPKILQRIIFFFTICGHYYIAYILKWLYGTFSYLTKVVSFRWLLFTSLGVMSLLIVSKSRPSANGPNLNCLAFLIYTVGPIEPRILVLRAQF